MMRVLVAFGSRRGGTAGLAAMFGAALSQAGCEAVVMPAAEG
jgi:menaquinone-dependent protoporphyrinogen oxidase